MWALWLLIMSSRSLHSRQASLTLVCSSLTKRMFAPPRAPPLPEKSSGRFPLSKIRPARDVVSLGTAFAAGTRRTTKKTKARLRAFLNRRRRFKALSRAKVSVARELRTGGTCALPYGKRPLGVSVAQRRAVAAAACTNHCGAELNISLVIADAWNGHSADPAFEAHVGVAIMWSLAIFERWVNIEDAQFLKASTLDRLAGKMAWAKVFGPAAAIIVTLRRIGWFVISATEWETDLGVDQPQASLTCSCAVPGSGGVSAVEMEAGRHEAPCPWQSRWPGRGMGCSYSQRSCAKGQCDMESCT